MGEATGMALAPTPTLPRFAGEGEEGPTARELIDTDC